MAATTLLEKIKIGLGITGDFQDDTLNLYIDEVKVFMKGAGISESVVESEIAVGCIMRGVADLWNYGSGNAHLSAYFKQRMLQIKAMSYTDTPEGDERLTELENRVNQIDGVLENVLLAEGDV